MAALMLALIPAVAGCAGSGAKSDPWTYALSRSVYPELFDTPSEDRPFADATTPGGTRSGSGAEALLYVGVIALPFLLDTAFLPIALPRDLICAR